MTRFLLLLLIACAAAPSALQQHAAAVLAVSGEPHESHTQQIEQVIVVPRSCHQTLECYGRCDPVTRDCVGACDQQTTPTGQQDAHAVLKCFVRSGCATQRCVDEHCREPLATCR